MPKGAQYSILDAQHGSHPVEAEELEHGKRTIFSVKGQIHQIDIIQGDVTTVAVSQDGYRKILRYDMKALVRRTAIGTMFCEGTVFTADNSALCHIAKMLLVAVVVAALTVLVFWNRFSELEKLNTVPLEHLAAQINAFVPFVLALYVSLSLARWWQLRVIALGKVFDAFASLCMLLNSELHEGHWTAVRTQVAKYGFASVELIMQAARDRPNLKRLEDMDMLNADEVKTMLRQDSLWHRPVILWSWIMRICVAAMDHHYSPAPRVMAVMNQCLMARQGIANINTFLDTQLPFAYVHLITLLVNIQNFSLAVKAGVVVAKNIPSLHVFIILQQLALCCIVCFIYQALLQITYMLMDPFGDEVLDFPIKAYMEYLAAHIDAMAEAQADCPVVCQDGSIYPARSVSIDDANDI